MGCDGELPMAVNASPHCAFSGEMTWVRLGIRF